MSKWGQIPVDILRVLQELGPSTAAEVCDALGRHTDSDRNSVRKAMAIMRISRPRAPKRIYIKHWIDQVIGERRYPRPVYAIGDQACARKPQPRSHTETQREWREKRAKRQINSVWALGISKTVRFKTAARGVT